MDCVHVLRMLVDFSSETESSLRAKELHMESSVTGTGETNCCRGGVAEMTWMKGYSIQHRRLEWCLLASNLKQRSDPPEVGCIS